jgi:hypothetical protein
MAVPVGEYDTVSPGTGPKIIDLRLRAGESMLEDVPVIALELTLDVLAIVLFSCLLALVEMKFRLPEQSYRAMW